MILSLFDFIAQYSPEVAFLRIQWRAGTHSMARFQASLNSVAYLLEQGDVRDFIIDLHELPSISIEDQMWLTTQWIPRVSVPALQQVGLVLPARDVYNQLVVESLIRLGRHFMHYDIQFFPHLPPALDWLVGQYNPVTEAELEAEWAAGPLLDAAERQR
ncbi:hypothetical protein HNQ93_003773 [Hymenobacter luteus]|uniref:STAS/SEC14 domain-containing protein n=2 Tax=Hymenobacter TaxID=89966 RepID=A0A7W9T3H7_9BACT|nr:MULTISPECIES: hypothetical protein [Hymenobacter]MBB4603144.1 hypothetical protein [Hymenobacter latericoloratus]MBB6060897.1 hypothetical protein [Hymenobacter luteus]